MTQDYGASQIKVLEGLEAVKRRPGMYIGTTDVAGLHHLVWEVADNAIDEAMAGFCCNIEIIIRKDGMLSVEDDGRGIPVEMHEKTKKSALETVMTMLHAGGKFGDGGYKVSGGLHGVGISVVNALSTYIKAEVFRDGYHYEQEYRDSKAVADVKRLGKSEKRGTKITFLPDKSVFETVEFNFETIVNRMRQQAYLTKGVSISIFDERSSQRYRFYFEGGIKSYVSYLNRKKEPIGEVVYIEKQAPEGLIEVALQYTQAFAEHIFTFANNIFTTEGGMHLTGFKAALTRSINNYARKQVYLKEKDENLSADDVREGLTAVLSIKVSDPQFEGQTKTKLGNPEIRTAVESVFGEYFTQYLEEHPSEGKGMVDKCVLAARARMAARAARDTVIRKAAFEGMTLPGKLADCSSKNSADTELFIVEGDSAGGCFHGDTLVALTDGRNVSFKDLVREHHEGKQNFCYTIREDGSIGVERIVHPRVTKKAARVIKVILDNGEEIICTPDHFFMLRDGSFKEAQALAVTDSLMPLRFVERFFEGDHEAAKEAVTHYNHKIVRIEKVSEKYDVYDIEVPHTHNFALASGVFVHNSAKQGRNREFQAILPLRGKILNVEQARMDKILANNEIKALIIALGVSIGETFDASRLRYDRVVIMTDADVDGAHIRTLLLTMFYRHFRELIEKGHVYIAQPPLYKLSFGKKFSYVYSDSEKQKVMKEFGTPEKVNIQRYKGLGEMNPEQLWETTMDPARRMLLRVAIEDAERADSVFDTLMGDDVAPRKKFIQAHAKRVKNLDI